MKSNEDRHYIKIRGLDTIYKFVVDNYFYLRSLEDQIFILIYQILSSNFWIFRMTSDINIVYTKAVAHNVIHKYLVDNIFIWDSLEAPISFQVTGFEIQIFNFNFSNDFKCWHCLYQICSP